jgi:hypothetical protein
MIYPLRETRPNLHLATGVHVKHVTFDEYVWTFSPHFWQSLNLGTVKIVLPGSPSR